MFYQTANPDHGLPYNPFKALVAPRPIGWISSRDQLGRVNLAPYSFFNGVGDAPPIVMFSSSGYKDSIGNIEQTGEFVCNVATWDLREAMNQTSAPVDANIDEFEFAGLTKADCHLVDVPRVAESPANLECKYLQTVRLADLTGHDTDSHVAFGQVVGIHIRDDVIVEGIVDVTRFKPLSRLGYRDYAAVERTFAMNRPHGGGDAQQGPQTDSNP
jgi:flavin reductase (DIM6/NTAB) family NADH-FMN oxidoreductase RutF